MAWRCPRSARRSPSSLRGGDDTDNIKDAIKRVSDGKLVNGFRGAVKLARGVFHVRGALDIAASGVVLRGWGTGAHGTVVNLEGDPRRFITIGGDGGRRYGATTVVAGNFGSGARWINVRDASGFKVGDKILIQRTVTAPSRGTRASIPGLPSTPGSFDGDEHAANIVGRPRLEARVGHAQISCGAPLQRIGQRLETSRAAVRA